MAGSSNYPASKDNYTEVQDGISVIQADDVNDAYAAIDAQQTYDGVTGKSQAHSVDLLDFVARFLPTVKLSWVDADTVQASAGIGFGLNSGESIRLPRRNTGTTNITFADLDTGARAANTTYYVYQNFDATATTTTYKISTSSSSPTGVTTFLLVGGFATDGSQNIIESTVWSVAGMRVVQIKAVADGALATGSGNIPDDDTVPQNTEGDEYITIDTLFKSSTNKALIGGLFQLAPQSQVAMAVALFQDSTASALVAGRGPHDASQIFGVIPLFHFMTTGTANKTTFKIRAGATSGTTNFNGTASLRKFGGVANSILFVIEFEA